MSVFQHFGIINVDKPKGFTSHDVVAILRRILNIKQIGHTGTLDPMAVGVLPVCIGKATKIIQYLDTSKAYRAYIKLGIKTNTYDADGEIVDIKPVNLNLQEVEAALQDFQGEITQKPPMHSAVHYKGKRLYEYVRLNVKIEEIPERKVTVYSIKLIDVIDKESVSPMLIVDIECSGGTYIRSIANDLGEKLGYGASLAELIRTRSGKFILEESHSLEKIAEMNKEGRINDIIINPVCVLNLKCCKISPDNLEKIKHGQYIKIPNIEEMNDKEKIQLVFENKLAAIAEIREDKIFPINVFI